jgi:alpha-tubulin suppressor-like RCC1 family protein
VYSFGAYVNDNVPLRELPPPDRPDNDDVTAVLYKGAAPFGFRPEPRHVWKMPQLVHKIAAGEAMSAAILVDETLVTWGRDIAGELGRHITEEQRDLLLQAKEDEDDENKKAHLGRMISDDFFTPKPVIYNPPIEGRYNVLNVACGAYHMLAVVRRGGSLSSAVYGCGNNILGQLGLGDTENRNVLTLVRVFLL